MGRIVRYRESDRQEPNGRLIGYPRVSTKDQNLDRQLKALNNSGCELIYQEKISGTKKSRPELDKMLADLKPGDIVVVQELTRVSRSTLDMLDLVKIITEKGCFIKSLNESWLDTSSPAGKLMLTIFAGMAEFERELMLQRCQEGREAAIEKGVKMGRTKQMDTKMEYALKLYEDKAMSIRKICEVTGVSKATLCRRIAELKETGQVVI